MSQAANVTAKDAVRTFNKYVLNPAMRVVAGRKHWYASAIRHTGRRSGKTYVTPVVAETVTGGFVIPLPYGTRVDWLRNVVAAGRATIVSGGRGYEVVEPQIIGAATAAPLLSSRRRRVFERFDVDQFVLLTVSESADPDNRC